MQDINYRPGGHSDVTELLMVVNQATKYTLNSVTHGSELLTLSVYLYSFQTHRDDAGAEVHSDGRDSNVYQHDDHHVDKHSL